MDEARAVLDRLDRIERLERARADPSVLLAELRELVVEAEAWARRERDPGAEDAARRLAEHAPCRVSPSVFARSTLVPDVKPSTTTTGCPD